MEIPASLLMSSGIHAYVAVKASLHASDSAVFGLNIEEQNALTKRFNNCRNEIVNGVLIKGAPIDVINALGQLGYRVVGTTGEAEIVWTMQHELDFERGIWYAAQYGDIPKVLKLLNENTCPDHRDKAGYTALHYAARNGHLSVCEILLEQGADINATTKHGNATALHRACSSGKYEIVKFLLSNKADCTLQDADGKTALHRATENNFKEIGLLILSSCPETETIPDFKGKVPADYSPK